MKKFTTRPKYISAATEPIWIVTIAGDDGNVETGPHPYYDEVLVQARSAEEACKLVDKAEYVGEGEGCDVRTATQEEIELWTSEGFRPLTRDDI